MSTSAGRGGEDADRNPASLESLGPYVRAKYTFETLPEHVQLALGGSRAQWELRAKQYAVKHALAYTGTIVETLVRSEMSYLEQLIIYTRRGRMLYPYHLQGPVQARLRLTPFGYYRQLMVDVVKGELPYDSLPNFTAADAVHLLGIGRNEFINLVHKVKAKGWLWRRRKGAIKELLPSGPVQLTAKHWWRVWAPGVSKSHAPAPADSEAAAATAHRSEAPRDGAGGGRDGVAAVTKKKSRKSRALSFLSSSLFSSSSSSSGKNKKKRGKSGLAGSPAEVPAGSAEDGGTGDGDGVLGEVEVEEEVDVEEEVEEQRGGGDDYDDGDLDRDRHRDDDDDEDDDEDDDILAPPEAVAAPTGGEKTTLEWIRAAGGGGVLCGTVDREHLEALYRAQQVFMDVPVAPEDQISVPPLQGFVMNRVQGDFFERLLYEIFVTADERTSVSALAELLGAELDDVRQAVSIYCRLGFARKKNAPRFVAGEASPDGTAWHPSWAGHSDEGAAGGPAAAPADPTGSPGSRAGGDARGASPAPGSAGGAAADADANWGTADGTRRVGFLFDSTLTAFLMMGNLSQGLKTHAVTMFEVGKLSEESMPSFVEELGRVNAISEGEARRFFDHAVTLRETIAFLRDASTAAGIGPGVEVGLDLVRIESLNGLDPGTRARILKRNYALLVSMSPISPTTAAIGTHMCPFHVGPPAPIASSPWLPLFMWAAVGSGPRCTVLPAGTRLHKLPSILRRASLISVQAFGAEPVVCARENALPIMNEILLSRPISARVVYPGGSIRERSESIPAPFSAFAADQGSQRGGIGGNGGADDSDEECVTGVPLHNPGAASGAHATAARVAQALGLAGTVGHVSVLTIPPANTRRDSPVPTPTHVPLTIEFGLPLFDGKLNKDIIEGARDADLLTGPKLTEAAWAGRSLVARVMAFVREVVDGEPSLDGSAIPWPTRTISFDGSRIVVEGHRIE